MVKKLKLWNGRGLGRLDRQHINVAAYSQKQAAELVSTASGINATVGEIKNYFAPCWGNPMDGIIPTVPCLWVEIKNGEPPKQLI